MSKTVNIVRRYINRSIDNTSPTSYVSVSEGGGSLSNYYTTLQLDDGVLDARYYTETELDAGQLDNRYYTETELDAGQLDNRYFTETESDNRYVQVAGDSMAGTLKGDAFESESIAYSTGFTGQGWSLHKASTDYALELDDLKVRGTMSVYDMEVRKIRATNGTLWVSNGIKVLSGATLDSGEYYLYVDQTEYNFNQNDIIKAQQYSNGNVYVYDYYVFDADPSNSRYAIRGYDQNPFLPLNAYDQIDLTNISFESLSINTAYYDFYDTNTGASAAFKTTYTIDLEDKVGKLYFSASWINSSDDVPMEIQLFNSDDVACSSKIEFMSSDENVDGYLTLNGSQDDACYLRWYAFLGGTYVIDILSMQQYLIDHTITDVDYAGIDFVRIGNLTDIDRQGSILLTADEENAPYISVIDEVNTTDILAANHKVRLGNLNGLSFNGIDIGGYGLYAENAYLSGEILSSRGNIGGWEIDDNFLEANTSTGGIIINAADPSILFTDEDDLEKIKIHPGSLTSIQDLLGAASYDFADTDCEFADLITTLDTYDIESSYNDVYILVNAGYIYDAVADNSSYHIDLTDGKSYSFRYDMRLSAAPSSALDPGHTMIGYYKLDIILRAYNEADDVLWEETKNLNFLPKSTYTISFSGDLGIADDNLYFRIFYKYSNFFFDHSGLNTDVSIEVDFLIETTRVKIDGADGKIELSPYGMNIAYDTDQYFSIDGEADNDLDDAFIKSAGAWVHTGDMKVEGGLRAGVIVRTNTASYTLTANDEIFVWDGSAAGNVVVPDDAVVGKKYIFVNITTGYDLNIKSDTGLQVLRGGGNSSISLGTNAFSNATAYVLGYMRTMIIQKVDDGEWLWVRY